ncbi:uncharacterized protein SPSK_01989 [Sporothrix schenckii 1099-18]|uniref:Uncharacterized protein n=1 Tax=Sporothrix schenckii 1099-18 TaxID=1397361 RepID=A0A0F2MFV3_SPOSC|nr:uncharacterized protein SPSK_01989 [Sporothrix schenckii 1099-18]KJR87041.1 hypothetical protein SPSK_01989 [Sporothrix schenckii 1099-18]
MCANTEREREERVCAETEGRKMATGKGTTEDQQRPLGMDKAKRYKDAGSDAGVPKPNYPPQDTKRQRKAVYCESGWPLLMRTATKWVCSALVCSRIEYAVPVEEGDANVRGGDEESEKRGEKTERRQNGERGGDQGRT